MRGFIDSPKGRAVLAAALALLVAVAAALGIDLGAGDDGGKAGTVTIPLRGAGEDAPADRAPGAPPVPDKIVLGPAAQDELAKATDDGAGAHAGERDEAPPGVPFGELALAAEQQTELAKSGEVPTVTPLAAPYQRGCRTRLVGNYSSRNGVPPRLFVLHFTVSSNRAGFADVDAITAYFNSTKSQASSNYVVDDVGNCNYIVRETSKAWTQGAFNPVSISVEQIATGRESDYAKAAGYRKLGRILHDASRRWHFPLRRGATSGCTVTRSGVVDHDSLGCGNSHTDVRPFAGAIARVIREAKALDHPITATDRSTCRKLNAYRRDRHRGHVSAHRTRINVRRREALSGRGLTCTAKGPVRR